MRFLGCIRWRHGTLYVAIFKGFFRVKQMHHIHPLSSSLIFQPYYGAILGLVRPPLVSRFNIALAGARSEWLHLHVDLSCHVEHKFRHANYVALSTGGCGSCLSVHPRPNGYLSTPHTDQSSVCRLSPLLKDFTTLQIVSGH